MPDIGTSWKGVQAITEDLARTRHMDDPVDVVKIRRVDKNWVVVGLTRRQAKRLSRTNISDQYSTQAVKNRYENLPGYS